MNMFSKKKIPQGEIFSDGMYDWSLFLVNLFLRVKEDLKIDYDSFMIIHVVAGNYLYQWNKDRSLSYDELSLRFEKIISKSPDINKITVTSLSMVLNIPRETVKRKVLNLIKKQLLFENSDKSIMIGKSYVNYFQNFVLKTTTDLSMLMKKWKRKNILDGLINYTD